MSARRDPLPLDRGDLIERYPFTTCYLALLALILVSLSPGWWIG